MRSGEHTDDPFQFNYKTDHPVEVKIEEGIVKVKLADGRILQTPLQRHPWLASASPEQQANVELGVFSVDWPDLDEGLDIEWMRQEMAKSISAISHRAYGHKRGQVAASVRSKNVHVVPSRGEWAVKQAGYERASRTYETEKQATQAAKQIAKKQGSDVVVHGPDGRIKEHVKADDRRKEPVKGKSSR